MDLRQLAGGLMALCAGSVCILISIPWAISCFLMARNGIRTWARIIDSNDESYADIEFQDSEGIKHQTRIFGSYGGGAGYEIEIIYNRYNPAEAASYSSSHLLREPAITGGMGLFWCVIGVLILCDLVPVE